VFIVEIDGWREFIIKDLIVKGCFIIVVGEWNRMKYNDVDVVGGDDWETGWRSLDLDGDIDDDTDDDVFVWLLSFDVNNYDDSNLLIGLTIMF